jgi:HK97 family phage portal protein
MSIIKKIMGGFSKRSEGETEENAATGTFNSMSSLFSTNATLTVTDAMKFTAVYAAMRLRAENIASMPKQIFRVTNRGKVEAKDSPIYRLIKYEPNSYMSVFSFWEFVNACLDGWGNSYVKIIRNGKGTPTALIPIHPYHVTITFDNRRKIYSVRGTKYEDGVYTDDEMLHFYSISVDGIRGVNPIVYNCAAISAGIESTKFGNEFFQKGGNIKGVLEIDRTLSMQDFVKFQEKFNRNSNYDTAMLDGGWKYRQIGIAPEAAQMLQTRTFCIQDIARIFNVPPHMLAELSRSTFSNIEHQDIQFVKYSLRSTVKRYETELERKLLFSDEEDTMEIKFNLDGLLRGDMSTRSSFYHNAILDGWLTRNEVRSMENRNMEDGLDEFLYPSNENVMGQEQFNE